MAIQAVIEEAILLNKPVTGFVSDIIKAFEFLPRQPISCGLDDALEFHEEFYGSGHIFWRPQSGDFCFQVR